MQRKLCIYNLANCLVQEAQLLVCFDFQHAFLTKLNNHSGFLKVRVVQLFLSLECLEAIVGVINWPVFSIVESRNRWSQEERERWEWTISEAVRTYTTFIG